MRGGSKARIRTSLAVCLIAATALAALVLYWMARTRLRTEELLRDIQTLKVGEATTEDVERFVRRYGGRVERVTSPGFPPADHFFVITPVQNQILEQYLRARWKVVHSITTRKLFGHSGCCALQGWRWLGAYFRVKDGIVTGVRVNMHIRRKDGFAVMAHVEVVPAMPEFYRAEADSYHVRSYHLTAPGGGKGIRAILTPRARSAEQERAFDLNVSCLTTMGGCTEFSEIVPLAWQDHQAYLRRFDPK